MTVRKLAVGDEALAGVTTGALNVFALIILPMGTVSHGCDAT